jgi:hypothetical protein
MFCKQKNVTTTKTQRKHFIRYRCYICLFLAQRHQWARASSFTRFLDHTQRRTTVGRTPLNELSARRRDLYLTTHSTHNKHPCSGGIFFKWSIYCRQTLRYRFTWSKCILLVKITTKGTFSSYCMSWCVRILYSLRGRGQGATHNTCTVDCKLNGDCSFSVELVMPRKGYRWLPGEVSTTCDAPGACGSSAIREGLEC